MTWKTMSTNIAYNSSFGLISDHKYENVSKANCTNKLNKGTRYTVYEQSFSSLVISSFYASLYRNPSYELPYNMTRTMMTKEIMQMPIEHKKKKLLHYDIVMNIIREAPSYTIRKWTNT